MCQKSWSQLNENNKLPNILPPSPNASEFLKYGEIPINKYTGMPNISIPLYTIQAKGLQIPIYMSYHSNGIKVSEEASWVGLGWTLNEGGSIVQVINGYDDFGTYQNRNMIDVDAIASVASNGTSPSGILNSCNGTLISLDEYNFNIPGEQTTVSNTSCSSSTNFYNLPLEFKNSSLDYEPDVFKFNMLGYSGEFVLNWDTNIYTCLTDSKMRINAVGNGFQITVPDGHKFVFEKKEESEFIVKYPSSSSVDMVFNNEKASRIYKLTDIYTNKNDHIQYNYSLTPLIENLPSVSKSDVRYKALAGSWAFSPPYNVPKWTTAVSTTEQQMSYVSSITFSNGTVLFNTSSRIDLLGAKKLDRIEVRRGSSSGTLIKTFDFNYSYFTGHANGTDLQSEIPFSNPINKTTQELTHRLKLNSITESDKNPHIFEYNTTQLPKKTSLALDYWGCYNGYLNNQTLFPNIFRFNVEVGNSDYNAHNSNNRSPNFAYLKAGILEKIIYPTKGYTIFEYEMNSFDNHPIPEFANSSTLSSGPYFGAGLRIKDISSYDHTNTKEMRKTYIYTGGKLMTPIYFFNYTFLSNFTTDYWPSGGGTDSYTILDGRGYKKTLSSSSFVQPSVNGNGNYVGYDEVTETYSSVVDNVNTSGKIKDIFVNNEHEGGFGSYLDNSQSDNGIYRDLSMPLRESLNSPNNGSALEQQVFDHSNNLLKKVVNTYSTYSLFCTNGARLGAPYKNVVCLPQVPAAFNAKQMLGVYPIRRVNSLKTSSVSTDYLDSGSVTNSQNYFYNNKNQLHEIETITSNGDLVEIKNYYPEDISSTGIDAYMKSEGFWSPLLKREKRINGSLKSVEKFNYTQSITSPVKIFNLSSYEYGKDSENNLEDFTNFHLYDDNGNILEVSKTDGMHITYIWGHNDTYPVAKLENATHSQVSNILGNNFNIIGNLSTTQENNLRNGLPNALITVYRYDALVGVTSIVDYKGYKIDYEYDSSNRLETVRDANGKIMSKNSYNYKN